MTEKTETSPLIPPRTPELNNPSGGHEVGERNNDSPTSVLDVRPSRQTQLPQQTDRNFLICWVVGGIVVFVVCLIVVLASIVLLSQPNTQDALLNFFMGQSCPWVLSCLVFSTSAGMLIWKMESGQSALAQQMESGQSALASKLDYMADMMRRQHEENNMVMATTKLVTSLQNKA